MLLIWLKGKKLNMDEVYNIHGLWLIAENEEDFNKALQVVHQLWCELPGRYKDYIAKPKCNGYQSLHTVILGEGMVPLEDRSEQKRCTCKQNMVSLLIRDTKKMTANTLLFFRWWSGLVGSSPGKSRDQSSVSHIESIQLVMNQLANQFYKQNLNYI